MMYTWSEEVISSFNCGDSSVSSKSTCAVCSNSNAILAGSLLFCSSLTMGSIISANFSAIEGAREEVCGTNQSELRASAPAVFYLSTSPQHQQSLQAAFSYITTFLNKELGPVHKPPSKGHFTH